MLHNKSMLWSLILFRYRCFFYLTVSVNTGCFHRWGNYLYPQFVVLMVFAYIFSRKLRREPSSLCTQSPFITPLHCWSKVGKEGIWILQRSTGFVFSVLKYQLFACYQSMHFSSSTLLLWCRNILFILWSQMCGRTYYYCQSLLISAGLASDFSFVLKIIPWPFSLSSLQIFDKFKSFGDQFRSKLRGVRKQKKPTMFVCYR